VAEQNGRRVIPDEIDELGPDSLKVTDTDRGTIEDADLYAENFGGFGLSRKDRTDSLVIGRASRGPKGWAGTQPDGPSPETVQAIREAEQRRPEVTQERDRAEWLDAIERPAAGSIGLILAREFKFHRLAEHTERRIQKLFCRRYRPSAALEAKRFPRLPTIATKLLLKEARQQPAAECRAELAGLVAEYLAAGGRIKQCPPETMAARPEKKIGRPLIGVQPLTPAERKRRSRANGNFLLRPLRPYSWRNVRHRG
jgi:hypothetical protein